MRHPFRRKNADPKLLPLYAVAAVGFALAAPTAGGFALGLGLVVAGEALRCWGAGHLVKNGRLTVSGPYARLRHPLYAGALLVALGFGVIAGGPARWLVIGAALPLFFLYYLPRKERIESARLERLYGAAYRRYRAAVPSLRPRLARWRPPAGSDLEVAGRWSAARFRENSEDGAALAVALGVALFALRPWLAP